MTKVKQEILNLPISPTYDQQYAEVIKPDNPMHGMIQASDVSRRNWLASDKQRATYIPQLLLNSKKYTLAELGRSPKIIAYEDPNTGLLVADSMISGISGRDIGQTDKDFMMLYIKTAYDLAQKDLEVFKDTTEFNMLVDSKGKESRKYKTYEQIKHELYVSFHNDEILSVIKHLNEIKRHVPAISAFDNLSDNVNSLVTFETTHVKAPNYVPKNKNTVNVPYTNPAIVEPLTEEQTQIVEEYLDTFLHPTDKMLVSSYLGAALMNVNVKRLGKYLVVQGEPEVGKSVFMETMITNLFPGFFDVQSSFDDVFDADNRHASATLRNARVTMYKEADWHGRNANFKIPDFSGLHSNNIKTMVSDGTITQNPKYKSANSNVRMTGMHIILTNYTPIIRDNTAYDRRFAIVHLKDTTMREKGEQLGLFTETDIDSFVSKHIEYFAKYFVDQYLSNPNLISHTERLSSTYDITKLPQHLLETIKDIEDNYEVSLDVYVNEIIHVLQGYRNFVARIDGDQLYLNVSNEGLSFTRQAKKIREALMDRYGDASYRKFSINGSKKTIACVTIPLES